MFEETPLVIPRTIWMEMQGHLQVCLPEEGCGLLGGRDKRVSKMMPVTNALRSPVRFRMNPEEQLRAFQFFDQENLDLVAIFHSHPLGPQLPSETDRAEFAYPGVLTLICTPTPDGWMTRAFDLRSDGVLEVPIQVE
jgi:proteasome lid subunit RPN8/RPN11